MSFLAELEECRRSRLRPTTTRLTNVLGQTFCESKTSDGTFHKESQPVKSGGLFMVIDTAPDEKLYHVMNGVYIGSQDAAYNRRGLEECQITHILNVATGIDNAFPEKYQYLKIELLDLPETDVCSVFSCTNDFIQKASDDNGRVLVHCNAGISRSACIILAYLLGVHRMSYEDASELLRTVRPSVKPNDGFVQQLKAFAIELARSNVKDVEN